MVDHPFRNKVTCTVKEACQATGLGKSKIYELMSSGHLSTTTVGRRRLISATSLLELVSCEPASKSGQADEPIKNKPNSLRIG
ncbi:MAG: excisionase family DNA-binding protein [Alphaproteobacteria bacterium]|jgi:excisionase family DNA binding protein|nr:excisionase family DNA-binding protein [Microbacterium sp.]MBN9556924.1 excisionase family DNA-binding protein [Alphaproteobacteria bacterium]